MTYSAEAATSGAQTTERTTAVCWSCSAPLRVGELFCGACGRVQPLTSGLDYFEVFALPRRLNLDVASLEREFYRLSRRLHPDVYAQASRQEQDWSLASSSLLNDAYRTLKDPLRRTEYLLKIEGIARGDEGEDKKEDRVPADLLEEVFELNMQLDELRMNRQVGEGDPQLEKDLVSAKQNFDSQLASADQTLRALWKNWDAAIGNGDDRQKQIGLEELAALLDRRRYVRNLVKSVDQALEA